MSNGPLDLPGSGWAVRVPGETPAGYLRRVYERRELAYFLAWRDLKLKGKQVVLGIAWTALQPVLQMLVFALLLGRFAGLPSERGLPYSVLVFAALVPWHYFATSLMRCATSLVENEALLTRTVFPRILLPVASLLPGVMDIGVSFAVLVLLLVHFRVAVSWTVVFLPLFLLLAMIVAFAVGVWLSALTARYRDLRYLLPFALQIWMLLTPVGYSIEIVPPGIARTLYELNPLAGIVRGVRWCMFGTAPLGAVHLISAGIVAVVLATGVVHFRRVERSLADVI